MWESTDGRHWTELTPPPVDGAVVQLPGNQLAALGTGESTLAIMRDGATWEQGSWSDLFGDDVAYVLPGATDASRGITAAAVIYRPSTRSDEVATTDAPPHTIEDEPVFSHYEILHSVDGVAWSRESVAELVGVDDDAISSVTRVQTAGNTVVVAVNLTAAEGEDPQAGRARRHPARLSSAHQPSGASLAPAATSPSWPPQPRAPTTPRPRLVTESPRTLVPCADQSDGPGLARGGRFGQAPPMAGIATLWKPVINVTDLDEGERFWSAVSGLSPHGRHGQFSVLDADDPDGRDGCDGIHTVAQTSLRTHVGSVSDATMEKVCSAISYALGY